MKADSENMSAGEPADSTVAPSGDTAAARPPAGKIGPKHPRPGRNPSLFRAFRAGRAVEGTITRTIKGGYEVKVGGSRGFCPRSQIDVQRTTDAEQHVGQHYLFRITQVRGGGDDFVLSRRAVLEEDLREEASAVRATLIEGAVMQGRVVGTTDFGAFVDLGAGVTGLVHISELSHSRIARAQDAVSVGDSIAVKILKLDEQDGRISLSARQAREDPWAKIDERFQPGKTYSGTVKRIASFGAFVELAPEIEALAPASEFPPSRQAWREGLEPEQSRGWLVLSVTPARHRISLAPVVEGLDPASLPPLTVGAKLRGKVQRVDRFGVFVWLGPGRVGMIPNMWTGIPRGDDVARRFPVADEVEVEVVEVAEGGRRIRLSRPGLATRQAEARRVAVKKTSRKPEPRPRTSDPGPPPEPPTPFGTNLADKLRAALGQQD